MKPTRLVHAALLLAAALPVCAHAEWMKRIEDGIMGTRIVVELWSDDPAKGNAAIDAVIDEMHRVDEDMSTYKPTSELSQVNAHAADEPVKVSPELFQLLQTSLEYSKITDGAFDITYASVGYLYDFHKHIHPTGAQIAAALPGINYRHVILDPG
ncbi:MAG TPA: FAD:protein FMN transferase, partial [Steroidobacteraceae bacterium]|nr:FAD:protein FMN transferase [Steroidobacteraceae bacterium]